jgi:hypothetical protein
MSLDSKKLTQCPVLALLFLLSLNILFFNIEFVFSRECLIELNLL